MKKNNKGFFLAETIVIIALVTTIMAFVYPNVAKLYENYKNKASYYDQTQDIYTLKAVYNYLLVNNKINGLTESGCMDFNSEKNIEDFDDGIIDDTNTKIGGLSDLYITGYMVKPSSDNYEFNKYLNRMKKTTYDMASYRLIGVFKNNEETRYASIKIDNPNPNRNCNLGGVSNETTSQ